VQSTSRVWIGVNALRVGDELGRAISLPLQMMMGSATICFGPNGAGRGQPLENEASKSILMAPSRGSEPLARALHHTLENHKGPVHVARYAKGTAKYVLTGGQDRVVRLWNPSLGTEIKSYSAHGYEVLSISV
jgi:hypothetical protein